MCCENPKAAALRLVCFCFSRKQLIATKDSSESEHIVSTSGFDIIVIDKLRALKIRGSDSWR